MPASSMKTPSALNVIIPKEKLTDGAHRIEVILRDGKTKRQIDHKSIRVRFDENPVNFEDDDKG